MLHAPTFVRKLVYALHDAPDAKRRAENFPEEELVETRTPRYHEGDVDLRASTRHVEMSFFRAKWDRKGSFMMDEVSPCKLIVNVDLRDAGQYGAIICAAEKGLVEDVRIQTVRGAYIAHVGSNYGDCRTLVDLDISDEMKVGSDDGR